MWVWLLIAFLLGGVLGPLILPGYATAQMPSDITVFWPLDGNTCLSPITISGPIFTDTQFWVFNILFSITTIVSLALGTLRALLQTRPQYLDAAVEYSYTWRQFFTKHVKGLVGNSWAAFRNATIVCGKYIEKEAPNWEAALKTIHHNYFVEPRAQLEQRAASQDTTIAQLQAENEALSHNVEHYKKECDAITSAFNNRSRLCTKAWDSADKLRRQNATLESEVHFFKSGQDVANFQRDRDNERFDHRRQLDDLAAALSAETSLRKKAELAVQTQINQNVFTEATLKKRTQSLRDVKAERDELRVQAQAHNVALRDAREYATVRKALHVCAERRGDTQTAAVVFATVVEGLGGNLQALGVDQRRYEALREWVVHGQDPYAAVQPCGFS